MSTDRTFARNYPLSKKDRIGRSLLVVWLAIVMAGLASLSVRHMAALPEPGDEPLLSRALLRLRRSSGEMFVVHVIYADCSCSRALFGHLVARGPFSGTEELILFVGADLDKQKSAQRAGFAFTAVSASELVSRFGLEAAPVLIEFDRAGQLRYAGGYYAHPAAIAPVDERIHSQLQAGADVEPLPVFGCAVSLRLQKSLDPLSLLYSRH